MKQSYPEVSLFHTEARSLTSTVVGEEFHIQVWLPPSHGTSNQSYPVLYLLDADVFFGTAASVLTLIAGSRVSEIPEIIVAGIGYHFASGATWQDRGVTWRDKRTRDLTPTAVDGSPGSGGGGRFLTFIRTELIPFIEASYQADPNDRALVGYSLGGLFVMYALFTDPGLFRRYAAGAPSLGYDERLVLKVEEEYAACHRSLPAALVMSTGSRDVDEDQEAYRQLDASLRSRDYDGFRYESFVFEGETHLSGPAPAFVRGVKSLFAPDLVG